MDFFGIGSFEFLFILFISFLLFGPEGLIKFAKVLVKIVKEIKKSIS